MAGRRGIRRRGRSGLGGVGIVVGVASLGKVCFYVFLFQCPYLSGFLTGCRHICSVCLMLFLPFGSIYCPPIVVDTPNTYLDSLCTIPFDSETNEYTGRLIHIAEHYEKQNLGPSPRWSNSMVVKGLLKQIYPDFNVAAAWKEIISPESNGDRLLSWSRKNAGRLIDKLQFHRGTATDVVAEAQRLAWKSSSSYPDHTLRPSDRVRVVSSPYGTEFGLQTWAEEPCDPSQSKQYWTSHPQPDVEMHNGGQPYI